MDGAFITAGIQTPTENDVLLGRGAGVNRHIGNVNFREIVKHRQEDYVDAETNIKKYLIVMDILQHIKSLNPPGRFVTQDAKTGLWQDVGDEKARKKIGQGLRENASNLRKKPVDKTRQSINFMTYTKDKTYRDVRHAIENEMIKKDSTLHQQLQVSYQQKQSCRNLNQNVQKHDEAQFYQQKKICENLNQNDVQQNEADMVFSMELTSRDIDKFLTNYRSGSVQRRRSNNNASMIDMDTVGTFSIEDMAMSMSSDISKDELDMIMISFRLDKT